jgi:alkaline phosphatase
MNLKTNVAAFCLCLLAFAAGSLSAQEAGIARFGIITDTHVTDKADQAPVVSVTAGNRYFTGGAAKIEAFANSMNTKKANFVIELGDFSDNPADGSLSPEKRSAAALAFLKTAEAKFSAFKGPRYHVFGNHDTDQLSKDQVQSVLLNTGIEAGKTWYSFDQGGVHCVVIDASYKTDGVSYSASNYTWDNTIVPTAEIEWLKGDLAATKKPTIVFTHQMLNPQDQIEAGFDMNHVIKNAAEVRSVLEKSGVVVCVFSGHYHDGGFQTVNGVTYVVLQASAAYGNDASYHNQYATVDVYAAGKNVKVVVAGNGNQKNYVINSVLK